MSYDGEMHRRSITAYFADYAPRRPKNLIKVNVPPNSSDSRTTDYELDQIQHPRDRWNSAEVENTNFLTDIGIKRPTVINDV
ncbi:hypothetical protein OUZ56_009908 [Daphnia magna]|uniref:Uncharacterized protein n=1 Tax=Daphnia magna TaxID=35525 RepID=A0ABR0AH72_9CRUS|nr:hypothetical protein OUZ56_009908 [Daphnia magna]